MSDHERAGFVVNIIKSHLIPEQIIDWLGFILDLREGCFSVPQYNVDRLKSVVEISPCQVQFLPMLWQALWDKQA